MVGDSGALRLIWQDPDILAIVDSVKAGNIDHDETLGLTTM